MESKIIVTMRINNLPDLGGMSGWLVVRRCDDNDGGVSLWYYGLYYDKESAEMAVSEIGNGLIVEVGDVND